MRHKQSDYLHWAKMQSRAPYNLATSGVRSFPLHELPFDFTRMEIHGDNRYGYGPLQSAIARRDSGPHRRQWVENSLHRPAAQRSVARNRRGKILSGEDARE